MITCMLYYIASCPALCHPGDFSPLGSSVHGILQATILEWVAIPSSRVSSQPKDWVSCILGRFSTIWVTREAWWFLCLALLFHHDLLNYRSQSAHIFHQYLHMNFYVIITVHSWTFIIKFSFLCQTYIYIHAMRSNW